MLCHHPFEASKSCPSEATNSCPSEAASQPLNVVQGNEIPIEIPTIWKLWRSLNPIETQKYILNKISAQIEAMTNNVYQFPQTPGFAGTEAEQRGH